MLTYLDIYSKKKCFVDDDSVLLPVNIDSISENILMSIDLCKKKYIVL
jgi:hypothetical protein